MSIFSTWLKKPLGSSTSIGNQIVDIAYKLPAAAVASLYSPRAARAVMGSSPILNKEGAKNLTYGSRIAAALFGGAYALGAFTPAAQASASGAMLPGGATVQGIGTNLTWTPAAINTAAAPLPGLGTVNSLWAAPAPSVAAIPSIAPTIAAANEAGGSSLLAKATGWAGLWKTLTGGSGALALPASNPADAAGGINIGMSAPGQNGDATQTPLGDLAAQDPILAGAGGSTAAAFIIPGMIIAALAFFLWKSSKK